MLTSLPLVPLKRATLSSAAICAYVRVCNCNGNVNGVLSELAREATILVQHEVSIVEKRADGE